MVGFSDHHAAETLFQAFGMLAVVLAVQTAEREKPVFEVIQARDVEITASASGNVFDQKYLFDIDPKTSQSTVFDTESVSDETVTFTASYRTDGENQILSDTIDLSDDQVPGEIRLLVSKPRAPGRV